jgi:hypothetical protein
MVIRHLELESWIVGIRIKGTNWSDDLKHKKWAPIHLCDLKLIGTNPAKFQQIVLQD